MYCCMLMLMLYLLCVLSPPEVAKLEFNYNNMLIMHNTHKSIAAYVQQLTSPFHSILLIFYS